MHLIGTIVKFLLGLLGGLVVLVAIAVVLIDTPPGRRWLSDRVSILAYRDIAFEGRIVPIGIWPPAVRVTDVRIANLNGMEPERMARIGTIEVAVSVPELFHRNVMLPYLRVADSEVHLHRDGKYRANWEFGADSTSPEPFVPPVIGALEVHDSRLSYRDVPRKLDMAVEGATEGETVKIKGGGTYQNQKFTLAATGGSILSVQKGHYPIDVTAKVGRTEVDAKGTIDDPATLEGMSLRLTIKGADAAELFPLVGIALPPTPPYDVKGNLTFDDGIWRFEKFSGHLGDSDISGNLSWDTTPVRPKLTAAFVSKKLDFKDLGGLIGAPPADKLVDPAQKEKARERIESAYVIPDAPLDIRRLSAMDADVTFTGKQVISPNLPLDDFTMKLSLVNRLMKVDPIRFGTADGDIVATLRVDARDTPIDTSADVRFKRLSLARLMEGVGKKIGTDDVAEGFIGGTAKLRGRGASLHDMLASADGRVGIGMEGGRLSNLLVELLGLDVAESLGFLIAGDETVGVRCVVADFGVREGLMRADTFVVDTTDTNVQGEGTVNLKGEKLDLRLVPAPKDVSILSLKSPIRVQGTLKKPDVSIEKEGLAVRGGAAVGLAALNPVAAILAFIEPGLGEDSDCARLMHGMNAKTGKNAKTDEVPVNPTSHDKP